MSASQGHHSYGSRIMHAVWGTPVPASYVEAVGIGFLDVGEVISINGLPMNTSVTKLTHLLSDGKAHEKIPGFLDAGQITFRLNLTEANVAAITALRPDGTEIAPDWGRVQWLLALSNGVLWYATGWVQGSPVEVPEDDRLTHEVTVEVSGRPVLIIA